MKKSPNDRLSQPRDSNGRVSPSSKAKTTENLGVDDTHDSAGGRSRFRSTYLGALSSLNLSSLSRLILDRSQLLLEESNEWGLQEVGHGLMIVIALAAASATALNYPWVQYLEKETQAFFFRRRGPVLPPQEIIILEIDESSLSQGQLYENDPTQYQDLSPIAQWPWQRTAYAIAIERVMQAGATAVAVDIILDSPSVWDEADDRFLQNTLERYAGKVILASSFDDTAHDAGTSLQLIPPLHSFLEAGGVAGMINYPIEPNERIHQFSQVWLQQRAVEDEAVRFYLEQLPDAWRATFVDQTIAALSDEDSNDQTERSSRTGNQIFFYGPSRQTFDYEPFWTVLDEQAWENHLKTDQFRGKVVLIGPTADLFQDVHRTPFGAMAGVEIHANAIATVLDDRAIADDFLSPSGRGGVVMIIVVLTGLGISYPRRILPRTSLTLGSLCGWGLVSYGLWRGAYLVFPTAIPLGAIALTGISYVITGLVREKLLKMKLRGALKQYASSPVVQDIISQQGDLQDLISETEKEAIGKTLDGRYEITEVLGSGGFGQTFIAEDLRRPGRPRCVVKQLRPVSNDPQVFHLSRRLFTREAETLEKLGRHSQIPQLLAYFEEASEFYLVQELIDGHSLRAELRPKQRCSERKVVVLLKDLLEILHFIHRYGVIHRDIKPSNIIRRRSDQKLVLIDFGAVKEIQTQAGDSTQAQTVSIGTRGYMPYEQLAGIPRYSSDIYAVGVVGIQAYTGLSPDRLTEDIQTGELSWPSNTALDSDLSPELKRILEKMTRHDFKQRYQTASEVLNDLDVFIECQIVDNQEFSVIDASIAQSRPEYDYYSSSDAADADTAPLEVDMSASTVPWPTKMKQEAEANSNDNSERLSNRDG